MINCIKRLNYSQNCKISNESSYLEQLNRVSLKINANCLEKTEVNYQILRSYGNKMFLSAAYYDKLDIRKDKDVSAVPFTIDTQTKCFANLLCCENVAPSSLSFLLYFLNGRRATRKQKDLRTDL